MNLARPIASTSRLIVPCTCSPRQQRRAFSSSPSRPVSDPIPPQSFWRTAAQSPLSIPKPPAPTHPPPLPVVPFADAHHLSLAPLNPPPNRKKDTSFLGWFGLGSSKQRQRNKDDDKDKKARWRLETERTLERTLKGANGRWNSDSGGVGLNMRCTTFNRHGKLLLSVSEPSTSRCRSLFVFLVPTGEVTSTAGAFGKGELCSRYGIQPRDLRKLDSAVPTVVPTILVRRAAILVSPLQAAGVSD